MISKLCLHYGIFSGSYYGHDFYDFPTLDALAKKDPAELETHLRSLGFGYRAKYIRQTVEFLDQKRKVQIQEENSESWLNSLRGQEYTFVKEQLLSLPGVGPKVADCVCMMSMDIKEALPVDTHVWQIAIRDYNFKGLGKKQVSLTDKTYKLVGDSFRTVFGPYTGWAHSVLFAADLKHLQELVQREESDMGVKSERDPESLEEDFPLDPRKKSS